MAMVLDGVGFLVLLLLLGWLAAAVGGGTLAPVAWLALVFLYEPGQVAWFGATLGHRLQNLRVIDLRTGGSLSYVRALVRAALKLLIGIIGFLGMAFTRRHQALHDLLTGSAVCIRDPARAMPWQYVRESEPLIPRLIDEPAPPPPTPVPADETMPAPPIEAPYGP
jgi:uncharacterized RDD family membrane protein YckC